MISLYGVHRASSLALLAESLSRVPNGTQQACRDSRMPHGQMLSGRSEPDVSGGRPWSEGGS